jgi:hypothetical protein
MFNAPLKQLFEDIGSNVVIGAANGSEYLFGTREQLCGDGRPPSLGR